MRGNDVQQPRCRPGCIQAGVWDNSQPKTVPTGLARLRRSGGWQAARHREFVDLTVTPILEPIANLCTKCTPGPPKSRSSSEAPTSGAAKRFTVDMVLQREEQNIEAGFTGSLQRQDMPGHPLFGLQRRHSRAARQGARGTH